MYISLLFSFTPNFLFTTFLYQIIISNTASNIVFHEVLKQEGKIYTSSLTKVKSGLFAKPTPFKQDLEINRSLVIEPSNG